MVILSVTLRTLRVGRFISDPDLRQDDDRVGMYISDPDLRQDDGRVGMYISNPDLRQDDGMGGGRNKRKASRDGKPFVCKFS